MRPSVREAFIAFTVPLEGLVRHMYADVKQLVTTGIGNLIDPSSYAASLPWRRPDGTPAARAEILAEWKRVKEDRNAARLGHRYAARITTLRLRDEDVTGLVLSKLDQNDEHLLRRFPDWETWPADAQLGTHSMAWALGPGFAFPKMVAALRRRDFVGAAVECTISEEGNPGVKPRNVANRLLFRNAARVVSQGLNPSLIYWPNDLSSPVPRA